MASNNFFFRREEIKKLKTSLYLRTILLALGHMSIRIATYICVFFYIFFGQRITSRKAFAVLGFFNTLRMAIAINIPFGIVFVAEARTALKRIKKVLLAGEFKRDSGYFKEKKGEVHIVNATVSMNNKVILENISISLSHGLVGVTGPIGKLFIC